MWCVEDRFYYVALSSILKHPTETKLNPQKPTRLSFQVVGLKPYMTVPDKGFIFIDVSAGMYAMCVQVPRRPEEGVAPRAGVASSYLPGMGA